MGDGHAKFHGVEAELGVTTSSPTPGHDEALATIMRGMRTEGRPRRRVQMAKWIALTALMVGLPFAGVVLSGKSLDPYLEFPPKAIGEKPTDSLSLSWVAFAIYAVFIGACTVPVVWRLVSTKVPSRSDPPAGRFPWWGWAGLALGIVAWTLAWTRFPWFERVQRQTFVPLWAAYLIVSNAVAARCTGRAPALAARRRYLALFAASAVFWWSFEYLNRFAQNWRYVGIQNFGAVDYGVLATLAFATVLPAYFATHAAIASWTKFDRAFANWIPIRLRRPKIAAVAAIALSAAGLAGLGIRPDLLFALVWVSPVLVVVGIQTLRDRPHVFSAVAHGDWRRPLSAAAAALVCGFFWEMWNYFSLAQWEYDIPYVGAIHVFEMPILGYAGYLPFGLMCATVADAVMHPRPVSKEAAAANLPGMASPTGSRARASLRES